MKSAHAGETDMHQKLWLQIKHGVDLSNPQSAPNEHKNITVRGGVKAIHLFRSNVINPSVPVDL